MHVIWPKGYGANICTRKFAPYLVKSQRTAYMAYMATMNAEIFDALIEFSLLKKNNPPTVSKARKDLNLNLVDRPDS